MTARPFEPGWEIGIRKADQEFIEVGTVQRIAYNGRIIIEDSGGCEIDFEHTGSAVDADENGYPYLVPLTREWRAARRMAMMYKRLEAIHWRDWEDSFVREMYDLMKRRGAWEWCEDTEEDYSADIRL